MSKRKILILSSTGGYGHIASTNTLKKLLKDDYDFEVIYPINELRMFGVPSGERFYNFLLANNLNWVTNWIVRGFIEKVFLAYEKKASKLLESHIEKIKPDLLISLIPFVNYPASEAARKQEIPFLLLTTDNDLHNWVFRMEKLKCPNFSVTIGNAIDTTVGTLEKNKIQKKAIKQIGLPLRPEFINVQSKEDLREKSNGRKKTP